MNFSKLWQALNREVSFDENILGFDLLFQLSYMAAVAAAGIPRSQMFEFASQMGVSSSRYFKDVQLLTQRMNYDYAEACRIVGDATKEEDVKSLLLRLSASLSSGQPEKDFLAQEVEVQAECYGNEYKRRLESLKKWTDAYIALLVSTSLIIIVALISTVIYSMGTHVVVGLVGTMTVISALGVWTIYRTAPREIKPLSSIEGCRAQALCRTLMYTVPPIGLAVSAFLTLGGVAVGWILMVAAAFLLPVGLAGMLYDGKVGKKDEEISVFTRSVGRIATAIGSTLTEALSRIDYKSLGTLSPGVKRLRIRLRSGLARELCWQRFVVETGSELVSRSVKILLDGTNLGGDPQWVGLRSSFLALKVHLLRAERRLVSSTFSGLCIIMHAAIVGILLFVTEVVSFLGREVANISMPKIQSEIGIPSLVIFSFSQADMRFFYSLLIPTILILSVVNAFAAQAVAGGYAYKFFYYFAVTLASSGAIMLILPKLTSMIFRITAT